MLADVVTAVKLSIGNAVPVGIRISQGKVNDFTSKWQGGEADAEVIFGTLCAADVDFIHVTKFEALQPAIEGTEDSARSASPSLCAERNDHCEWQLAHGRENGKSTDGRRGHVTVGRAALANPDLPKILESKREPRTFDGSILQPIASIKEEELAMQLNA